MIFIFYLANEKMIAELSRERIQLIKQLIHKKRQAITNVVIR